MDKPVSSGATLQLRSPGPRHALKSSHMDVFEAPYRLGGEKSLIKPTNLHL